MNESEQRIKKVQSDQERRYIIGKIRAQLDRIIELDDTVPFAQHLITILRTKGETQLNGKTSQSYYWSNDKLFAEIENHYKEYRKKLEDRFDGLDGDIDADFLNSRIEKHPEVYGK